MKNKFLILFILTFSLNACSQKKNNKKNYNPLDYIDMDSFLVDEYKKYYTICNSEKKVKSFKEDKNILSTDHDKFLITIIDITSDKGRKITTDIIKKQFEYHLTYLNQINKDRNNQDINLKFLSINNRNATVVNYYKIIEGIKFYHKDINFFENGDFNGKDKLYRVTFMNTNSENLKNDYKYFKKCFRIIKPI